ncbi:MAG: LysR family transcriptional regulator [Rubritepida sp.]|nr:LysR family transcriptional regulator [Rubritepida sp.]
MARTLDVNALLLLETVASAGSLTRASTSSGLSIATISRRIALLEQQVGTVVLKRNSRGMAPTPVGLKLLEHARRISAEAREALSQATEMQAGLHGTLRVSLPAEFGHSWLGRAVAEFAVAHPDILLEIDTHDGTVDVVQDPYDVVVVLGEPSVTHLVRRRLATLRRGLYAAPKYLERYGTPETLDDLATHRCLGTTLHRDEGVWTFSRRRHHRSVAATWRATVDHIGLLRELVVGGVGIGMLNEILCQSDVRTGRLQRLLPEWSGPPLQATAMITSRKLIPRRSRAFVDFVARQLG